MKTIALTILLFTTASLPVRSQLVLNAGDTFTYDFTLPLVRVEPSGFFFPSAIFIPGIAIPGPLDLLQVEAFEGSTAEAPICSFQWGAQTYCEMPGAWRDAQGSIRLSVLQGSVTVNTIRFHVETPIDMTSHNVYDLVVVPVPEPSTWSLMGVLGIGYLVLRRCR